VAAVTVRTLRGGARVASGAAAPPLAGENEADAGDEQRGAGDAGRRQGLSLADADADPPDAGDLAAARDADAADDEGRQAEGDQ
jgi:hypothetical protein